MTTLQIRDQRARSLARELAEKRRISMTEAVIQALRNELDRDRQQEPLADRLGRIAGDLAAEAQPGGRRLGKDEIDAMWGH